MTSEGREASRRFSPAAGSTPAAPPPLPRPRDDRRAAPATALPPLPPSSPPPLSAVKSAAGLCVSATRRHRPRGIAGLCVGGSGSGPR